MKLARSAPIALVLAASAGCSANLGPSYDHLQLSSVRASSPLVSLDPGRIRIPVAMAASATVRPAGASGEALGGEVAHVALRSEHDDVLKLYRGLDEDSWVFVGATLGSSTIVVTIEGVEVDRIPADVVGQSPAP